MAMHRRPLVDGPPLELVEFRPDDWLPAIGDVSPYAAWLKARFEWAKRTRMISVWAAMCSTCCVSGFI